MHGRLVRFKRGDTFLLQGVVRVPDAEDLDARGKPRMKEADLAEWGIRSQLRLGDKLITEFVIEKRADISPGAYTLRSDDTQSWPVSSQLVFDVQYTLPTGQIISSVSIAVDCKQDNTR